MMDRISLILVIVGALNWLLVGLFQFDLVSWIFGGQANAFARILYALVGIAGLWSISLLFRRREPRCSTSLPAAAQNRNTKEEFSQ